MTDLFTSRWANKELAWLECVPVGVSRSIPRFPVPYRYRVARRFAPNDEAWQHDDERDFAAAYRRQLEEIGPEAVVRGLARISEEADGLPLVLLCFEPADKFCHRHMLRGWLQEHGVEISELAPGDVAPRRGTRSTLQPTLFDDLPREERV